jgi:hypothetical protein
MALFVASGSISYLIGGGNVGGCGGYGRGGQKSFESSIVFSTTLHYCMGRKKEKGQFQTGTC